MISKIQPPPRVLSVIAALLLATLVRLLLTPLLGSSYPLAPYAVATIFAVWWGGGILPGVLALVLGAVIGSLLFGPPPPAGFAAYSLLGLCMVLLTEPLRASQARATSAERRLEQVLNTASVGVCLGTSDGRIHHANPAFLSMLGYTAKDVENGSLYWQRITAPEYAARDQEARRALQETGACQPYEKEYLTKDGHRIPVLVSLAACASDDMLMAAAFVTDLTPMKQAEEARRESEQRHRLLFEIMAQGVIYQDADARIVDFNPAALRILGLRPEQLLQRGYTQLPWNTIHEDGAEFPVEDHPAMVALRDGVPVENVTMGIFNPGDKSYRWVSVDAAPIFASGEKHPRRVYTTLTDITERKRVEEALQRSESRLRRQARLLTQADQRKDEFLAMLAHELRNPLAPIRNALDLIRLDAKNPVSVDTALSMANRQLDHLVRLVDDLLDVARITRGTLTLKKKLILLQDIIENAVETSKPWMDQARHQLQLEIPDEPLFLEADLTRLAQTVSNLLINAAKYTEPGGTIRIVVECQQPDVLIHVQDNGGGIPEDRLEQIFGLFMRAEAGKRPDGLGVGLALTKSIVEMHGGSVRAYSEGLGKGAKFTVRLPVHDAPSRHPVDGEGQIREQEQKRRSVRVLVVDDNRDAANSTAALLTFLGHDVQVAYDGESAIEASLQFLPQVVLLDIGMPGMNGYEVARHLRREPGMRRALLIALTGWGQEGDFQRSREAGLNHHLVKPLDLAQFSELLARYLKSQESQPGESNQ